MNNKVIYNQSPIINDLRNKKQIFENLEEKDRNNRSIALYAIKMNPDNIFYIWGNLKNDISLIWEALKLDASIIKKLNEKLNFQFTFDNLLILIKYNASILKYLWKEKLWNKHMLLKLIEVNSDVLNFVDNTLKNDKEFMLNCINKNYNSYYHLWWLELEEDKDILEAFEESEINSRLKEIKKEENLSF